MNSIKTILKFQAKIYWKSFCTEKGKINKDLVIIFIILFFIFFRFFEFIKKLIYQIKTNSYGDYFLTIAGVYTFWLLFYFICNKKRLNELLNSYLFSHLSNLSVFALKLLLPLITPVFWSFALLSVLLLYPMYYFHDPLIFLLYFLLLITAYIQSVILYNLLKHYRLIVYFSLLLLLFIFLKTNNESNFQIFFLKIINNLPSSLLENYTLNGNFFLIFSIFLLIFSTSVFLLYYIIVKIRHYEAKIQNKSKRKYYSKIKIPFPLGEIVKKDIYFLLHSLDIYLIIIVSIQFFFYINTESALSPIAYSVYVGLLFAIPFNSFFNYFGFDTQKGMLRYNLLPISSKSMIISKNISLLILLLSVSISNFLFILIKYGIIFYLKGIINFFSIFFLLLSFSNSVAIRFPVRSFHLRFSSMAHNNLISNSISGTIIIAFPTLIEIMTINESVFLYFFIKILFLIVSIYIYFQSINSNSNVFSLKKNTEGHFQKLRF